MRQRRLLRPALITAAVGAACLAFAAPALAAPPGTPPADPPGANGTIKIDGQPFDNGNDNEPHVTCNFRVTFSGFDEGQRANIVFNIHPPSGNGGAELLRLDNVLVSDDAAGGGQDRDKVFTFSANQFKLNPYRAHPKQGYHIKLNVDLLETPGRGKHKVFWLKSCAPPASPTFPPPASPTPSPTPTETGSTPLTPGTKPTTLPKTPVSAVGTTGLLGLGLALVGGGSALLLMLRRRRDNLA
ncbi:MAG TPA: hypothetical protein VFX61_19270 [Micromonosporaceae bacterium]|nr:hypothetical protein [Micromonosporaceae bacterium]